MSILNDRKTIINKAKDIFVKHLIVPVIMLGFMIIFGIFSQVNGNQFVAESYQKWFWLNLVIMSSIYVFFTYAIKADKKVLLSTFLIMLSGIYIQLSVFTPSSPVRNVIGEIYETARQETLSQEYEKMGSKKALGNLKTLCQEYQQNYQMDQELAANVIQNIKTDILIDLDNILKKAKEEKIQEIQKITDKNKREQKWQENIEFPLRMKQVLSISQGERIEQYLLNCKDIPFEQALEDEIAGQYQEHLDGLIINSLKVYIITWIFLILFCLFPKIHGKRMLVIVILADLLIFFGLLLSGDTNGAMIAAGGINWLEFSKIAYLFFIVTLLCQPEQDNILFSIKDKFFITKRHAFWLFFLGNILMFGIASELGTMTVLLITTVFMLLLYYNAGYNQKLLSDQGCSEKQIQLTKIFKRIMTITVVGVAVVFFGLCVLVYQTFSSITPAGYAEGQNLLTLSASELSDAYQGDSRIVRTILKIDQRVYSFVNKSNHAPADSNETGEDTASLPQIKDFVRTGGGEQYYQMEKGRATAGLMVGSKENGFDEIYISEGDTDMVFSKFISNTGIFWGIVLLFFYFILVCSMYNSIRNVKDTYYKGLGMAGIFLLFAQTFMHILVNLSLFPITGVPLMYVSHGGSIQMVSMSITFMLLLISSNEFEREHILEAGASGDQLTIRCKNGIKTFFGTLFMRMKGITATFWILYGSILGMLVSIFILYLNR